MHAEVSAAARTGPGVRTSERELQLLPIHPLDQNFPARIVLRGELAAAGVKDVAAGLRRQRLLQKAARRRIAGVHQDRGHLEVLARLLLVPGARAGRKPLEPKRIVALGGADVAAGMPLAVLPEDRLPPAPGKPVSKPRGPRP